MAHRFTFTVTVELERSQGKFAARDEMAEALMSELENADPGGVYGIGADGASDYDVVDWSVEEA
jgi:hypothetical protein